MAEKVTFVGSFPAIQSAIKISGNGDGMRIMIDIPESEMGEAVKLMLYRQVPLRITIEPDKHCLTTGNNSDAIQKRGKRKSEWQTAEE